MKTGTRLRLTFFDGHIAEVMLLHNGNRATYVLSNMPEWEGSVLAGTDPASFGYKYSWVTGFIGSLSEAVIYFKDAWDATSVRHVFMFCPKEAP